LGVTVKDMTRGVPDGGVLMQYTRGVEDDNGSRGVVPTFFGVGATGMGNSLKRLRLRTGSAGGVPRTTCSERCACGLGLPGKSCCIDLGVDDDEEGNDDRTESSASNECLLLSEPLALMTSNDLRTDSTCSADPRNPSDSSRDLVTAGVAELVLRMSLLLHKTRCRRTSASASTLSTSDSNSCSRRWIFSPRLSG